MKTSTLPPLLQLTQSTGVAAARGYLIVSGSFLLVTGIVGFMLDTSFPTTAAEVSRSHGHIFGVLETNGWHNLAAVGIGVPSLAVALLGRRFAAPFAFIAGASNLGVFIVFALFGPETLLVASNSGDQVLHALLALGGLGFGTWGLTSRHTPRPPGESQPAPCLLRAPLNGSWPLGRCCPAGHRHSIGP